MTHLKAGVHVAARLEDRVDNTVAANVALLRYPTGAGARRDGGGPVRGVATHRGGDSLHDDDAEAG